MEGSGAPRDATEAIAIEGGAPVIPRLNRPVPKWRLVAATVLLAAGVLGAPVAAHAGLPPLTPITPIFQPWLWPMLTESTPATVTGVVHDTHGHPVPGVTVSISGDTSSTDVKAYGFSHSAVTTADGSFVLADIIQGTYQLDVDNPDTTPTVAAYGEQYVWYDGSWMGQADTRHFVQGGTTVNAGTILLKDSVTIHGQAYNVDTATGVSKSQVTAYIEDGNVEYMRWATTASDGTYSMAGAPPGDWRIHFSGSGRAVPEANAQPGTNDYDNSVVTQTNDDNFTVAAGANTVRNGIFANGRGIYSATFENYSPASTSFVVPDIGVTAAPTVGDGSTFSWTTDDSGKQSVYLPLGTYDVMYNDGLSLYDPLILHGVSVTGGTSALNLTSTLTANTSTSFAVWGTITQTGSSTGVESWIEAAAVDPGTGSTDYIRRTASNGTGGGGPAAYMFRLPFDSSSPGNQTQLDVYDETGGTSTNPVPITHVHQLFTVTGASGDVHRNVSTPVGGTIAGTVHDELGSPCQRSRGTGGTPRTAGSH